MKYVKTSLSHIVKSQLYGLWCILGINTEEQMDKFTKVEVVLNDQSNLNQTSDMSSSLEESKSTKKFRLIDNVNVYKNIAYSIIKTL